MTCSANAAARAGSHHGICVAHLKSFVSRADGDVVPACARIEPDANRTRSFADASHAAARLRGGDGNADRRQKDAASSCISSEKGVPCEKNIPCAFVGRKRADAWLTLRDAWLDAS